MKSPRIALEVLAASFALDQDVGVNRPGALVHHRDVGGIPVAEGPGFQTIPTGVRTLYPDADALLKAMTGVLDGLYAGYTSASQT